MSRKLLAKTRVKTALNDTLKTLQTPKWLSKIDDDAIAYFIANAARFFTLDNETDLLNVIHEAVPVMYHTAKAFRRHRIISDDVAVAFIINTKRKISLREDASPS